MNAADAKLVASLIRDVSDFPSSGILFKDITPMLRHSEGFAVAVRAFADVSSSYDLVAGVEARGFIFAAAVAQLTGKGFVPIRKSGKLPAPAYSESYALEYGENTIQIHEDAIKPGERVLLIDDVLATGGTLGAAAKLVERCGGVVESVAVLLEIIGLGGQANFAAHFPDKKIEVLLS
jgi:adenine phosphoribosyltransferase